MSLLRAPRGRSRRAFLAACAGAVMIRAERWACAAPRTRYGGRLAMHVPWPIGRVDPHRLDDAFAACFGECLFDTLYVYEDAANGGSAGGPVPSLAESDPVVDRGSVRVKLRAGVRFASGAPLDARAAADSIERARSHDAGPWLADLPPARVDGDSLVFTAREPHRITRALASPLIAIVPPRFSPDRPDGTGPFRAQPAGSGVRLARNPIAANGPAYLDAIDIEHAPDLVTSLRAFESGADDVGWLGAFLHEPRSGARAFDGGAVGWAVLHTGRDAGPLDAPGTAQALADGVPYAALAPFVVGPSWPQGPARWTGPPCDLVVRDDSPWLAEVARALAVSLSSPGHEVSPHLAPVAEVAQRRAVRAFALSLDVTRPAGPGELGAFLGLAGADDAASALALARRPPRLVGNPRAFTRAMRVGIVGEVRVQGGRAADLSLPPSPWGRGIDWGNASRALGGARV